MRMDKKEEINYSNYKKIIKLQNKCTIIIKYLVCL